MNFKFDVKISEQDYVDFNDFVLLKSTYGKKETSTIKTCLITIILIIAIINLLIDGFSVDNIVYACSLVILGIITYFLYLPVVKWLNKLTIKDLNKKGKPCYSPSSIIEFNDDSFTETTTDGASTVKYRAIENVYVANGKAIYIHLNKMLAYILPESTFECSDQFNAFLQFLSTKTDKINLQ